MKIKAEFQKRYRLFFTAVLSVLIFSLSFSLSVRGSEWGTNLHPDEAKVANWIIACHRDGYLKERVYPTAFFKLAEFAEKYQDIANKIDKWDITEGAENRFRNAHEMGLAKPETNIVFFYRKFNALINALGAIFAFWTALIVLKKKIPAAAVGILVAVNPFFIEFAHYCETDSAMVFTMSASMFLGVTSVRKKSIALAMLTSFMMGFTISSKYTLLPLVIVAPTLSGYIAWVKYRSWLGVVIVSISSLALTAAGFLTGTPAIYKDWTFFKTNAVHCKARTYGEMDRLLGEMHGTPGAANLLKLRSFLNAAARLGIFWWIWLISAVPLWFTKEYKRYFAIFPMFMMLFCLYAVFGLPWFRTQEFIPMIIPMTLTAALPLTCASNIKSPRMRYIATALSVAALVILCRATFLRGARISTAFAQKDNRHIMRDWLSETYPSDYVINLDSFSTQIKYGMPCKCESTTGLEHCFLEEKDSIDGQYYLRVSNMDARGTRHPWTMELYPRQAKNLEAFTNQCERIFSFTVSSSQKVRPTFAAVDTELWRIVRDKNLTTSKINIPLIIPRPIRLAFGGETYFPFYENVTVGPEQALRTVGKRTKMEFHAENDDTYYAVSRLFGTADASVVSWNNIFKPSKKTVTRGHAVLFKSNDVSSMSDYTMRPGTRVRMRHDESKSLGVTTVTRSKTMAASILRSSGSPDDAAALLADAKSDDELIEAARALMASGKAQLISTNMINAVQRAIKSYEDNVCHVIDNGSDDWKRCKLFGTSLQAHTDFSRIRLYGLTLISTNATDTWTLSPQKDYFYTKHKSKIPVVLVPGTYKLNCRVNNAAYMFGDKTDFGFDDKEIILKNKNINFDNDGIICTLTADVTVKKAVWPNFWVFNKEDKLTEVLSFEITWNVLENLKNVVENELKPILHDVSASKSTNDCPIRQ